METIGIGIPCGGGIKPKTVGSLIVTVAEQHELPEEERVLGGVNIASSIYISRNRNDLTEAFLEDGDDWHLMIDSDIQFRSQLLYDLLDVAHEVEADVVAVDVPLGIAPTTAFSYDEEKSKECEAPHWRACVPKDPSIPGYFAPAAATAIVMVRRSVYEVMAQHTGPRSWWAFAYVRDKGDPTLREIGEDLAFFYRLNQLGGQVWIARDIWARHLKETPLCSPGGGILEPTDERLVGRRIVTASADVKGWIHSPDEHSQKEAGGAAPEASE